MEFSQENDLWQRLQKQSSPMERRLRILEMVKLLLEKTDMQTSEISLYDPDELTDLFLEYQEAGKHIHNFFEKALPHLDPEYKGEPFEKQLQELQQKISDALSESARVIQQTEQLQKEEKHLNAEIAGLETVRSQAEILERNVRQLREYHSTLVPGLKRLETISSDSRNLYTEIQDTLLTAIPRMTELLKENFSLHQEHYNQNEKITKAFSETRNLPDLAANTFEINRLSRSIREQLQNFDQLLAGFIQVMENHLKAAKMQREI